MKYTFLVLLLVVSHLEERRRILVEFTEKFPLEEKVLRQFVQTDALAEAGLGETWIEKGLPAMCLVSSAEVTCRNWIPAAFVVLIYCCTECSLSSVHPEDYRHRSDNHRTAKGFYPVSIVYKNCLR